MRIRLVRMGTLGTALLCLLTVSAAVEADPIAVTSGVFALSRQNSADIRFAGGGFSADGRLAANNGESYDPPYFCNDCGGRTFNLSLSDSVTQQDAESNLNTVSGFFSVGGRTYSFDRFDYAITASDFVAPFEGNITTPFRFAATAMGTTMSGGSRTVQLTGSGRATAQYSGPDGWLSTEYRFQDVTQTPEVGTSLLLASGLLGLFATVRRSRRGTLGS